VAVLNPNHLFEQANKLITIQTGPPRQVDIRRAISAAYYATFHATITAAADQFIGVTNRDTSRYGLVYRSVIPSLGNCDSLTIPKSVLL
jgi:hypothetical protein